MNKKNIVFNWDSIGHERILDLLEHFIVTDNLSHAYIFYGRSDLGKHRVIESFIQNILCFSVNKNTLYSGDFPCGKCDHCRQIRNSVHPDIQFVEREIDSKTGHLKKNISIEQIRVFIDNLRKAAFLNSYKFGIIKNAHLLSEGAFNSLLKTLEEPSKKTILILDVLSNWDIPKTILSRCQPIYFYPVGKSAIRNFCNKNGVESNRAEDMVYLSYGYPDRVLGFLDDIQSFTEYKEKIEFFIKICRMPIYERFKELELVLQSKKGVTVQLKYIQELLQIWVLIMRDILLVKYSLGGYVSHGFVLNDLQEIGNQYSIKECLQIMSMIKKIQNLLKYNINPQLAIENVLLTI